MERQDIPNNVVDLAMYRAVRAVKRGGRRSRPRYVLWYPGVGYFRPLQRAPMPGGASRPA